jgi:glutamate-ammonia-ligase adenylyltransferase
MPDLHEVFTKAIWPDAGDSGAAERGIARLTAAAAECGTEGGAAVAELAAHRGLKPFFDAIFGNSPFLGACAERDPAFVALLLTQGPDSAIEWVHRELAASRAGSLSGDEVARSLRINRSRAALAIAVADIAEMWSVERVVEALSRFADEAIGAAVDDQLRMLAESGVIELASRETPSRDSGLVVLGMGKLGGYELNYSSDVDLIVLYDLERVRARDRDSVQKQMVKLVRGVVRLLEERTDNGYVLRTDLRLRPDPGATPLAMSTEAAEFYYENMGQNWERAAMIKARPVAGDIAAGDRFLAALRPYVWRRNLDFAAIQDIHSIKRQIHAHRGGGSVAIAGHNIKVGRGGIREIEFFAQTQQLIWGGRQPTLRSRSTCRALAALAEAGHTTQEAVEDLTHAYRHLRRVEHRLQMIADQQTQTLPADPEGLAQFATFLGHRDVGSFSAALLQTLRTVERHYARLFEEAPALGADRGNLVFTGTDDDPGTLETLARLGFSSPPNIAAQVRAWHHGRYRCMRSPRARELLTELMPALLAALGGSPDPEAAFLNFDRFMSRLPAGVQIFSLFHANPQLLGFVAEIMGGAPRLAESLSARPSLLDSVLATGFATTAPRADALHTELDAALTQSRDFQDTLDIVRRWKREREFTIGVMLLRGTQPVPQAGHALTDIAETALAKLLPAVIEDFARVHGHVVGAEFGVVALGKFGGREMTFTSDLDLVLLYDLADEEALSDGEKKLPPSQYFIRLAARFVNAITSLTPEGQLYEVDMRLRPSGSKGPIAVSLEAFRRYNATDAWTWEQMALTRARVIAAPPALAARIDAALAATIARSRDLQALVADVAAMRRLMARERKQGGAWDVKNRRGGLVDVEFVAQFLILRHARECPGIADPNTVDALARLAAAALLDPHDAAALTTAHRLCSTVQAVLRVALIGEFEPEAVPKPLLATLARAAGARDFNDLAHALDEACTRAHGVFEKIIPPDAANRGRAFDT